jgi:hypothetical protein
METLSTDVFGTLLNALGWDLAVAAALFAPPVLVGIFVRPGVLAAVGGAISLKLMAVVVTLYVSGFLWWDHTIEFQAGPVGDYVFGAVLALVTSWALRSTWRRLAALRVFAPASA